MMLLNEAYDHNEINRWIIDQAIILNNQFIHNIILIIIGGSSSGTLYIIQNVKDYITMTITRARLLHTRASSLHLKCPCVS